jgi:PAS domain S-box-containing protein
LGAPLRVLLIEDSPENAELIVGELRRAGYDPDAERVDTLEATVAALGAHPWDVIFVDQSLPGHSGYDALKLLLERDLDTPLILISGTTDEEHAVESPRAGSDFVSKVNLTNLVPAVERELTEARRQAERRASDAELRRALERYRAIVETAAQGIWTIDEVGDTTFVNEPLCAMLGYGREELLSRRLLELVVEEDRARVEEAFHHLRSGGDMRFELTFVHQDGGKISVLVSASPLLDEDGGFSGSLGMVEDISDRKLAERRLAAQHAVASILVEQPEIDAGLDRILRTVCRALDWKAAAFWEVDESAQVLRCRHFWTPSPDLAEFEAFMRDLVLEPGMGLPGQAWKQDEPFWIGNIEPFVGDPNYPRARIAASVGLPSGFAFPISLGNRILGVIEFLSARIQEPDLELLQMAGVIGSQIGQFIERTQGEERLRQSEARFTEAQRIAHIGSWEWNIATDTIVWSEELLRLYGVTAEEFRGNYDAYLEIVHPDDRERVDADVQAASERGEPFAFDVRIVRPNDGAVRMFHTEARVDLDEQGRTVRMAGTAQDVTEDREADERLRRSEERFRGVFESAGVGIAVIDPDSRIVTCNHAFARMVGYAPSELEGTSVLDLTHPDDRASSRELNARMFAGDVDRDRTEKRYLARDGKEVWVYLGSAAMRDDEGRVEYTIGIIEDLRERRVLEEQFLQAQKMEAVGRLAGGIAHDFNNLLLAINGYSELALSDLGPERGSVRSNIDQIKVAAQRAAKLTRELLAFSRKEILQPVVTDLNDVVGGMESLLRQVVDASVTLNIVLDPELEPLRLDPNRMEQALMNLAINARDAMPEGGRLRIATSSLELRESRILEHGTLEAGSYAVVTVSDTGLGMDDETKRRIFEPFYTTKEADRGTGLGLSTVFGFVKQSKGQLAVESEPGQGTTFTVFLPVLEDPDGAGGRELAEGLETVLLVEDDEIVRRLLAEVLEHAGYRVLAAADGVEAVEMAGREPLIDVVVTDLVMPELGGRAAAEQIAGIHPATRVIYMSGYTEESRALEAIAAETPFLQKPFDPADLLAKIKAEPKAL